MPLYFSSAQGCWFHRDRTTILPASYEEELRTPVLQWPKWAIDEVNLLVLGGMPVIEACKVVRVRMSEQEKEKANVSNSGFSCTSAHSQ